MFSVANKCFLCFNFGSSTVRFVFVCFNKGSSINDVTQFWTTFNPLPPSSCFLVLTLHHYHHKILDPFPQRATSLMDKHNKMEITCFRSVENDRPRTGFATGYDNSFGPTNSVENWTMLKVDLEIYYYYC